MVLRVDPKDTTAPAAVVPARPVGADRRHGHEAAHQRGDPGQRSGRRERLIETIKLNFGIPIDHYVQVNFAGFKKLVDSIGGVPIYFDEPVRGPQLGARHPVRRAAGRSTATRRSPSPGPARTTRCSGTTTWQLDPSGDLGRINRQQYFLRVALKRAISKGVRNPATLRRLVDIGVRERRHRRAAAAQPT